MEFKTISALILLNNIQTNSINNKINNLNSCYIIESQGTDFKKSLACNLPLEQIDDKSKLFIQTYMENNNIEEIFSIKATWTEGIE